MGKMPCKRCKRKNPVIAYSLVKCAQCGGVIEENFGNKLPKGWKLKIMYKPERPEITVIGNQAGLEYLANLCLSIINRRDLWDHVLLQWQMNNLLKGSTETYLKFSDDEKHYDETYPVVQNQTQKL